MSESGVNEALQWEPIPKLFFDKVARVFDLGERRLTDTVAFWQGEFGDAYTRRHQAGAAGELQARFALWRDILAQIEDVPESVLEIGANLGINLRALHALTGARCYAVEPNDKARALLAMNWLAVEPTDIRAGTADAIDFPDGVAELTFTSGVLIHVPPERLVASCREIHRCSSRYIACIEYFAAEPEEKLYRGHAGKLWKRDFGSFWLDNFRDLRQRGCGFAWRRTTGLDNLTWHIFEKRQ